jgi:hypothetical protein
MKQAHAPIIDHSLPPTGKSVIFFQTAAGQPYEKMLEATDGLHRRYCLTNDADFRVSMAVRRGYYPWQATFNRIVELGELADKGFDGWFVYLDADAVIVQPQFDLRRYLGKRERAVLIAAPGGPEAWNINAGVFFLNMGHPLGKQLVLSWRQAFQQSVSDQLLAQSADPWQPLSDGRCFPDDQHLLQMELVANNAFVEALIRDESGLISGERGRWIKQFLRATGSATDRLMQVRDAAKSTLASWPLSPP